MYRVRVYVRVHLYIHVPRDEDNGESLLDVCIRIYLPAGGHKSPKPGKSHITRENKYIYIHINIIKKRNWISKESVAR